MEPSTTDLIDELVAAARGYGFAEGRSGSAEQDAAEQSVRDSLARIRAVVTAADILIDTPDDNDYNEMDRLMASCGALTPDDRRLLRMEE